MNGEALTENSVPMFQRSLFSIILAFSGQVGVKRCPANAVSFCWALGCFGAFFFPIGYQCIHLSDTGLCREQLLTWMRLSDYQTRLSFGYQIMTVRHVRRCPISRYCPHWDLPAEGRYRAKWLTKVQLWTTAQTSKDFQEYKGMINRFVHWFSNYARTLKLQRCGIDSRVVLILQKFISTRRAPSYIELTLHYRSPSVSKALVNIELCWAWVVAISDFLASFPDFLSSSCSVALVRNNRK